MAAPPHSGSPCGTWRGRRRQSRGQGLSAREDSGTRLGLGSTDRRTARPAVPEGHLPAAGPSWRSGLPMAADGPRSAPPSAGTGAGGRHRLHFKVIVIFDLWDLRGHRSSILEPLTSNLWAIFMASKHCPLIALIEICIWFVGKGYGFPAQVCRCTFCPCFPPSSPPTPTPGTEVCLGTGHTWRGTPPRTRTHPKGTHVCTATHTDAPHIRFQHTSAHGAHFLSQVKGILKGIQLRKAEVRVARGESTQTHTFIYKNTQSGARKIKKQNKQNLSGIKKRAR